MTTVTIHEAKTHLSRLIRDVLDGQEITIARGRIEVAKIVPLHPTLSKRRTPNRFAHLVPAGKDVLDDGFWDPLPAEHLGLGLDGEDIKQ